MIRVERLYISPVKALALVELRDAYLDKPGIAGDRAFYITDASGRLFTQRDYGPLVRITPWYDHASGRLELRFPDGERVAGVPEPCEPVTTPFWEGRPVEGRLVRGVWSEALSTFAGRALRLVKATKAGQAFDGYPISMCSTASLAALARAAGEEAIDGRRFRQNIYLEGASPHEEDTWVGGAVRAGEAVVRVKVPDSRCIVTTRDPETGEPDLETLKIIASYRTDQPKQVNFGVYCTVIQPGALAAGDAVTPLPALARTER
jgi:hypothetical protein